MRGAVVRQRHDRPLRQAVVPVLDHGFVYGEGVYESLRTYNGVPFLYDRHMRAAAAVGRRHLPRCAVRRRDAARWIDQTRRRPAGDRGEAYIRILLTRGIGDLSYDRPRHAAPTIVIIVKPSGAARARLRTTASDLAGRDAAQPPGVGQPDHQVEQPAEQRAGDAGGAIARGAEEALMCNYRGELTECSQSNFFMVRDGVALTPRRGGPARRDHARVPLRGRTRARHRGPRGSHADAGGSRHGGRDLHHLHDARAQPGRQRGRPRHRLRQAGPVTQRLRDAYQQRAQEMTRWHAD